MRKNILSILNLFKKEPSMIFKRTSVRKYTNELVDDKQIELLLQAGMAAPSARNVQPWEFVVIKDRETLNKLTKFITYGQMLKEAPLAIVVCADIVKGETDFNAKKFWIQDCSAATQNIMLQAAELGLGSVWLGTYPKEEVYKPLSALLKLPENIVPIATIALGHPAGEFKPKDKFDKSKIHYEKWN